MFRRGEQDQEPQHGRYYVEALKTDALPSAESARARLQEALDQGDENGWRPIHFVAGPLGGGAAGYPIAIVWDTRADHL